MKLYNPAEIAGTAEFGGLIKPVIQKDAQIEMSCGTFELKPGESLNDYESHASDEIFYIIAGTLTVDSKSTGTVTASEGQIVRIPKDEMHLSKNRADKNAVVFWINRD